MLLAKGYRVVGFARRPEKSSAELSQVELFSADLNDEKRIQALCKGASAIIHLAALSSPWGRTEDFYRINVDGTRSIVEAAKLANVDRFIHVSTPSLYFNYTDRFYVSESDPLPAKSVNPYAATKKLAEEIVDQASSLSRITIRPRAIFGPHDQALLPRLLKTCQEKGIPCFTPKSPIVDVTYVENAAHALCLALEASDRCSGEKYNITNGEPILLWDLLERLLLNLSIPRRRREIPYRLAYGAAWLSEKIAKLTRKEPSLTRYGVGVMSFSQTLSIEKARKELNYIPPITLDEGIRRYVRWYQTA